MKYLIVSGDSFTDPRFQSTSHPEMDTSWPKWPELLAAKLGMRLINLAQGGKGNEFIYSTLQDHIMRMPNKDEIGLVIAAWSQCQRRDYQKGNYYEYRKRGSFQSWFDKRIDSEGDISYWVQRSLRYYAAFETLCERYNIPYVHTQMIDLYALYLDGIIVNNFGKEGFLPSEKNLGYTGKFEEDEENIFKLILSYDTILTPSKFIGWPLTKKLGGWPLNAEVFGEGGNEMPYIISKIDEHPNAAGQVKLAEAVYDWLG